ncbi:PhrB Deoxyribodipyrimidine photolyase [Pyrenophora tritici-repentis]|nr:PhrB Deoxyribodipyrimidine photolyase [Pyrenophora tritici-repentis]KAF7449752.1 PhrB Deoxyribodipyrimidine photolyase [Pyrenophora tritici-repentis]KAI1593937.1 PhrB Deoxyribodipyrimidine photolyase [Pyrenophora tritici-repentis]PZC93887.1 PhrB, Deoxyribodipyrimidine photolyase [Pyrenophora tritici-repentis]PZD27740.1 PhrB, Deoxyribodipyrimidine photolyase [Pyrenophora tritici-repentis]
MSSKVPRILLYVLRRDVRLSDNPIFHTAALQTARQTSWRNSANSDRRHRDDSLTSEHGGASFTHLLPVYVWSANQIEVSGFLPASTPSPYPEARSAVAKDDATEEKREEAELAKITKQHGVDFKVWKDEKFYIDDRDLPYDNIADLPNVYTTFRKVFEPLRDRPRETLPTPSLLPPLPPSIPPQKEPFSIPSSLADLKKALLSPLEKDPAYTLKMPPKWPTDAQSAHPFSGGESAGLQRIAHLVASGAMSSYKQTRNGMLGLDFSTKLSAYLAQGHITARQVHWAMLDFEEGRGPGEKKHAYGQGENEGTAAVRFELLWRDYMRLCMRKFGHKMFGLYGIQDRGAKGSQHKKWKKLYKGEDGEDPQKTMEVFERFRSGRTGVGLIDASNRELFVTGYTSNRARQNVASFLSSHLNIDWRVGAEWYECFLVDYDAASNWGNWQYVAGVGNDPRQGRVFNPVKQALDYDKRGEYIKAWVPELRDIKLTRTVGPGREEVDQQRLMGLYQAWKLSDWEKSNLGLKGLDWVEEPLTRIQFQEEVVVVIKDPTGIKGGKAKKRNGQRGSLVMAPRL